MARTTFRSIVVGLILTTFLAVSTTYGGSAIAQAIVRPFAVLGFAVSNRHQGGLVVSVILMWVCFSVLTWGVLAMVQRMLDRED